MNDPTRFDSAPVRTQNPERNALDSAQERTQEAAR